MKPTHLKGRKILRILVWITAWQLRKPKRQYICTYRLNTSVMPQELCTNLELLLPWTWVNIEEHYRPFAKMYWTFRPFDGAGISFSFRFQLESGLKLSFRMSQNLGYRAVQRGSFRGMWIVYSSLGINTFSMVCNWQLKLPKDTLLLF